MISPNSPLSGQSASLTRFVYAVSFISAIAALVYQVAWTRMLALTFGRTTVAAAAVVAGFMGGMALGAWLFRRLARSDPAAALRVYAQLELGIALGAAALTWSFGELPQLFGSVAGQIPGGLPMDLVRVGLVIALLLIPAGFMGATFPALCMVLIRSREEVSQHLGRIYGLSTLGAAAGALLAGFVLLETAGVLGAVSCAVAVNLLIAGVSRSMAGRADRESSPVGPPPTDEAVIPTTLPASITGVVLFCSGFATLAYEILWFRALQYLFGNSTYALTLMLMVFLLGLGLGALMLDRVVRRRTPERDLAVCQLAIAVLALLAISGQAALMASPNLTEHFSIFSHSVSSLTWWKRLLIDGSLALAIMLPATLGMGLSFPLATRLYLGDVRKLGARVGTSVMLSNLGGVLGSVAAALLILPTLGTVGGTRAVALVNLSLGFLVLARTSGERATRSALAIAAIAALVILNVLLPARLAFYGEGTRVFAGARLLFEEEGDIATVQVWRHPEHESQRAMMIDGATIAVSRGWFYGIYSKQLLLAHLPMVIDPRIERSLNIGLGSGSTLHALATYPNMKTLDVVEISAAVARASAHFAESSVLGDERVELIVEDASHFLLRGDSAYDLIISDGKQNPDFSSNWTMMSQEFYRNCLARMAPEGLLVQWTPTATLPSDLRTIARTFLSVFPHVEVFLESPYSMILVGSKSQIRGRPRWSPERFAQLYAQRDLEAFRIGGADALRSRWVAGGAELREVVGPGPLSTWNHSPLEFSAYKAEPTLRERARLHNLELLAEAERLARSSGGSSFAPPGAPYTESTRLVREAHLLSLQGRAEEARSRAEQAVEVNPADALARFFRDTYRRLAQ